MASKAPRVPLMSRLSGLILTLLVAAVLELLDRVAGIRVAGAPYVLLLAVAYAVLVGGRLSGLVAGALALAFAVYYHGIPGRPLHFQPDDAERLLLFALALPPLVLALGHLRARLQQLLVTERELRAAGERERERMTRILESITDVFFALDRDWRFTYVNQQAEALVGRSRQELLGRVVWEAFPELVGSTWEREYHRAVADGVPVHFEEHYPPLDAWLETDAYPSEDGLTIYSRDVTQRKQAQQLLATRVRQQALVAQLGLFALGNASLPEVLDAAARATAEGLGVELAKVLQLEADGLGLLLIAGVGWRAGAVGTATVPAARASQAGFTLDRQGPVVVEDFAKESRFTPPELLVEHQVVSGMSVTIGAVERPWGVLGAHSRRSRRYSEDDVHFLQAVAHVLSTSIEARRAQEELRQSRELFHQLAENLGEVLFVIDLRARRVEYANPAYEQVWGRSRESLTKVPGSWLQAIHPEDRARIDAALAQVEQAGRFDEEFRIVRPDGDVRWIRDRAFPMQGDRHRVVGLAEDVTLRRQDEENRARLLTAARQAAEARTQARDETLAIVAHDLRSPLTTILACTHLLRRRADLGDADLRQLTLIERAVHRASRLLTDLLDAARMEAGVFVVRALADSPQALCAEACEAIQAQLEEQGLKLACAIAPDLPPVLVEHDRILQVLSNLLGNALKFSPGGGRILTRVERCDEGVEFSVANTGALAPEVLPHLFERFWQARSADRRGAGLGLTIARGIVEAHGGRIWVTSDNDQTTFHFTVPAASARAALSEPASAPSGG